MALYGLGRRRMQGFPLHAGFFIDDSVLLVLKAQEISLHFPPCHDRYDTPMYERTESTESVDKLRVWPHTIQDDARRSGSRKNGRKKEITKVTPYTCEGNSEKRWNPGN